MFCKKGLLRDLTKFTGKHLCQSLFFNNVAGLRSSSKMPVEMQASSEQADTQNRPEVCREMLHIHSHAWTCLSIVTLECTSPTKRFPPKTVNEKTSLSTQSLTFILTKNQSDDSMVL